jgi:hypothetical protein
MMPFLYAGQGAVLLGQHHPHQKHLEGSAQEKHVTKDDINSALKFFRDKTPQITKDSLRVWKNYKARKSDPNYIYKFWARDIVIWLRENRKLTFETEGKIFEVFRMMKEMGLISQDAAIFLTQTVWALFYAKGEGIPDVEERMKKEDELRKNHVKEFLEPPHKST